MLGIPSNQVRAEVELTIKTTIAALEGKLDRGLVTPTVSYDLKGKTAGYVKWGSNNVTLNLYLLNNEPDMFTNTIPHEVCHVVQDQVWPRSKPHGNEWAHLMCLLDLEPVRCHQYDTVPARKRAR